MAEPSMKESKQVILLKSQIAKLKTDAEAVAQRHTATLETLKVCWHSCTIGAAESLYL